MLRVCFPELTVVFQEHMWPHSTCSTLVARFRLAYLTFLLMISYFCKVFQYFAALCSNRHILTFWILALCTHGTARAAQKFDTFHLLCARHAPVVPHRKCIHLLQKTCLCVYANSSLPVHQPSSLVTRSTRVIDSSRPSLLPTHQRQLNKTPLGCNSYHFSIYSLFCFLSACLPSVFLCIFLPPVSFSAHGASPNR